jgi:hypothetical protein
MIRRVLVLCAMAVAAAGVMAPAASAEVPVHVEGEELEMLEATTEGLSFQVFNPATMTWNDFLRCENHWELSIGEDGVLHVHDINIFAGPVPPYSLWCTGMDDCGAEWDGQIFEDEATGADRFRFTFCTNRTGPGTVTCDLNGPGAEVHCNNAAVSAGVRIVGEIHFNHAMSIADA